MNLITRETRAKTGEAYNYHIDQAKLDMEMATMFLDHTPDPRIEAAVIRLEEATKTLNTFLEMEAKWRPY